MNRPPELPRAGLEALAALVDRLGRVPAAPDAAAAGGGTAPAPLPPLRSVSAHGATWSRLRVDRRLREALAQVPAQAGPLNSSHVVHRALRELHGLSPAYLDLLLRQLDALLWLERSAGLARAPAAATAGTSRKTKK